MAFSTRIIPPQWRGHFDMLHDKKRNKAYAKSVLQLSAVVEKRHLSCNNDNNSHDDNHDTTTTTLNRNNSTSSSISSDSNNDDTISYVKNHITKPEIIFEIGCGSGLLSCLVANHCGNCHVVAFECIKELADIATETVKRNNLTNQITIW